MHPQSHNYLLFFVEVIWHYRLCFGLLPNGYVNVESVIFAYCWQIVDLNGIHALNSSVLLLLIVQCFTPQRIDQKTFLNDHYLAFV